ncbi:MAG: Crp/Fnr family transcriptional regulator [Polyangiales bacterium]
MTLRGAAAAHAAHDAHAADDADHFAQAIRAVVLLDDADLAQALALFAPRELARGEYLLRAGERAEHVALVVRGLVREHFVMPDGTERTKAFVLAGQPTGSLADLLSGAPSKAFIVAEEPTRLLLASYAESVALTERCPGWRRFGERLIQRLLLLKAEREYELLGMDAAERYRVFNERYPGLEARVAGRHVASYLGITAVHLSRLRRRRRSRAREQAAL